MLTEEAAEDAAAAALPAALAAAAAAESPAELAALHNVFNTSARIYVNGHSLLRRVGRGDTQA